MARTRIIKPEFFVSDQIARLSPWARLFFIGLWTVADRDGRMKYNPRVLAVQILPHDDIDVLPLFEELLREGLVVAYEAEGMKLLWIPTFTRHQKFHQNEKPSDLPAPNLHGAHEGTPKVHLHSRTSTSTSTSPAPQGVVYPARDEQPPEPKPKRKPESMADVWAKPDVAYEKASAWVQQNFREWKWGGNSRLATEFLQARINALCHQDATFDVSAYLGDATRRLHAHRKLLEAQTVRRKGEYIPPLHTWLKNGGHEVDCAETTERSLENL